MIDNSPFEAVHAYIEAAFAKHNTVVIHTASVLTLGNTPNLFKSKKQKLVTTSSTTVELVGLSDMKQYALSRLENLFGQGFKCKSPVFLQDNEPVLKMVASNGKTLKNAHMRTRQADTKAVIKIYEATLQHIRTDIMIADLLKKLLHDEKFPRAS